MGDFPARVLALQPVGDGIPVYCDLCAKYNITARTIPLKKGGFANQLGKPDYIFVCMDTVSHPLVISAQKEAKKHGARLVRLRRRSVSTLERELIRVTAQA